MTGRRVLLLAVVVYIAAWFTPSARVEIWLNTVVARGWEATLLALQPRGAPLPQQLLMFTSGLSNVLFIAAGWIAWKRPHKLSRGLEWAVWLAALVNTHWFILPTVDRVDLRAGYYMWAASFALLGVALHQIRTTPLALPPKPSEA